MNPLERLRAARLHAQRSAPTVDALLESIVGLHSTDYASPYLSAWARVPGFDAAALRARLDRGDGLFRVNAVRNTVHVVRALDLAVVLAATGPGVAAVGRKSPGLKARTDAEIDAGVDAIVAALAEGPLDNAALKRALPALGEDLRYWLMIAMGRGLVLRADGPGARSNRTRYVLAASRVPGLALPPAADARRALLLRAVAAFGPVTVDDLAWWLPAPKREVTAALASAGAALRSLTALGDTWWFPADLGDAPAPPREQHGAWLLPYEDPLLKGYQDRSWCLAPGLREVVFPRCLHHWQPPSGTDPGPGPHAGVNVSGEARPSVWWGGRVVGRWEEAGDEVVWQLHADIGAEGRAAVESAVDSLRGFLRRELRPMF